MGTKAAHEATCGCGGRQHEVARHHRRSAVLLYALAGGHVPQVALRPADYWLWAEYHGIETGDHGILRTGRLHTSTTRMYYSFRQLLTW